MFEYSMTSTKNDPREKRRGAQEQIVKRRGGDSSMTSSKFMVFDVLKWPILVDVEQNRASANAQVACRSRFGAWRCRFFVDVAKKEGSVARRGWGQPVSPCKRV